MKLKTKTKEATELKKPTTFKDKLMRVVLFLVDRREYTLIGMMLIIGVALSMVTPKFLTPANFNVMLNAISTDMIVAVPMAICMIAGHSDFSVGSNVCLSSLIAGLAMTKGASPAVGILIGLATGALMGFIMGWFVTHKVPTFVATLGGMYAFRGVGLVMFGAISVAGFDPKFLNMGRFTFLGIRAPILYSIIILIVGHLVLKYVNFFHNAYYIGSNPVSATLAGINSKKFIQIGFILNGIFCGFAGLVLMARIGSVSVNVTQDLHFKNIVGLMVGGVAGSGGTGNLIGGMLGILFMQLIDNMLVMLYIDPNYNQVFIGAILILAVALDQFIVDYRAKLHT